MNYAVNAPASALSFSNPYGWPRKPLLAANVVSTSQPLEALRSQLPRPALQV